MNKRIKGGRAMQGNCGVRKLQRCQSLLMGMQLIPKSSMFSNKIPLEKTGFVFASGSTCNYQLAVASGLGMGAIVHFSFQR